VSAIDNRVTAAFLETTSADRDWLESIKEKDVVVR
jgi:hypothetical protein